MREPGEVPNHQPTSSPETQNQEIIDLTGDDEDAEEEDDAASGDGEDNESDVGSVENDGILEVYDGLPQPRTDQNNQTTLHIGQKYSQGVCAIRQIIAPYMSLSTQNGCEIYGR